MRHAAGLAAFFILITACSQAPDPDAGPPSPTDGVVSTDAVSTDAVSTDAVAGSVQAADDLTCWAAEPATGSPVLAYADITEQSGLISPLTGMRAHAAAWGDVDGDLAADLFVGTFAKARPGVYAQRGATGPSPDRLLLGDDTGFIVDEQFPEEYGRTSGAVFADLDGDGDHDLVASRNGGGRDPGVATEVFENTGDGFAVATSGIDSELGGRSVGVLDIDEDGLLDLLIVEDRYRRGSSRLYRNLGGLAFEDVTESMGLGTGVDGLGIATSDLNDDGHTDVVIAGSNRVFAGTGAGLTEVPDAIPPWETFGNEDDVAGAAIADVNRDGRLDLVIGHHYNSTLSQGRGVPVRLYLNRTELPGDPISFEDITESAGLAGLPTKAPHVELADLDNDGWVDVVTTASASDGTAPAVFRNLGLEGGVPRFETPDGLGSAQYWVTGPTADVDRDGRLDILLVEWEPRLPSLLLQNQATSGHWLEVSVGAEWGGGIGTRVDVYEAGGAGDPSRLVGSREIVASLGYTAGSLHLAHFGLGELTEVDVVVRPPRSEPVTLERIAVDRHIRLPAGCGS